MATDAEGNPVLHGEALRSWGQAARQVLITTAAQEDETISYKQLADAVQDQTGIRTSMLIQNWVGRAALAAGREGEPLLSSLVVDSHGLVGDGYQEAINKFTSDGPIVDLQAHAAHQRTLCYRYPFDQEQWDIAPGEVVKRREVNRRYGGSQQAGICRSSRTPNILIFSNPKNGAKYGYDFDQENDDGSFSYTGEGRVGDQDLNQAGNRAIVNHLADGYSLRLFKGLGLGDGSARFIGTYAFAAYHWDAAPDRNGVDRKVIVFRLVPVGPGTQYGPPTAAEPQAGAVSIVEPEAHNVSAFTQKATSAEVLAERTEMALQVRYRKWLEERGHVVKSIQIDLPDGGGRLKTDLFDVTDSRIIEVKASSSRGNVRTAIGQVLDYVFQIQSIQGHSYKPAILLPGRPGETLLLLSKFLKIEVIWEYQKGEFRTSPGT
jgi:hypothetical protein